MIAAAATVSDAFLKVSLGFLDPVHILHTHCKTIEHSVERIPLPKTSAATWRIIVNYCNSITVVNKKVQLTQGLRATAVRVFRHLGFLKFESCTISSTVPENPTLEPNSISICKPVAKLWPFLYIQDGRQPPSWILSIGNSAIRSAFLENPNLEPNMEWIGCTVCEIFAFKLLL